MTSAIRLLAFAGARDAVGAAETTFPLAAPCTVAELLERICVTYPRLAPHRRSIRLAVNGQYAGSHDRVSAGDEVAIIPPVAGG
jgi:molybdopterin synthase catalytic subunit/molybdopterin synthase sulfur carrier subunit